MLNGFIGRQFGDLPNTKCYSLGNSAKGKPNHEKPELGNPLKFTDHSFKFKGVLCMCLSSSPLSAPDASCTTNSSFFTWTRYAMVGDVMKRIPDDQTTTYLLDLLVNFTPPCVTELLKAVVFDKSSLP